MTQATGTAEREAIDMEAALHLVRCDQLTGGLQERALGRTRKSAPEGALRDRQRVDYFLSALGAALAGLLVVVVLG